MRRASIIIGVIGVVLLVMTALWLLIAPGALVKYPSDLNKTVVTSGRFTLFVDPATGVPRARPQTLPLSIRRNIKVVKSSGSQATVRERSVEKVGPLPEQVFNLQYVIDRSSVKNLRSAEAFAYVSSNVVNRAPYYSINLPFDTGSGPYGIWKNEANRAYSFRQVGNEVQRDGLTLRRMEGTLVDAPAQKTYIDQFRAQGISQRLAFKQLAAQLKAQGVDLRQLAAQILPNATPAQRALIRGLVARGVPLTYLVSVRTRLLVEPKTGGIVSLDNINQTLSVKPDLSGLTPIIGLLRKRPLSDNPTVQAAATKLTAMAKTPPTKVFNINYGQTPASVADFASYTKGKADNITMVKQTIPWVLGIAGAVALIVAGGLFLAGRRRGPAVPSNPTPTAPKEPSMPAKP